MNYLFYVKWLVALSMFVSDTTFDLLSAPFKYNNKEINIGGDDIYAIQLRFNHKFTFDYEKNKNAGDTVVSYVNVKEKTIYFKKAVVTPVLYFEFDKATSFLNKASFVFFIDGNVSRKDFELIKKKIINPVTNTKDVYI